VGELKLEDQEKKTQSPPMSPGHHLLQGAALTFMADALFPLTGIITAAFLTRNLGAGHYGLLTLSSTLITWIELIIGSLFARVTIKIIGEAKDWRPIGAAVLRLHVFACIGAMAGFWVLAKPCARLLGEPELAAYLTLFAIDLPIYAFANCYRSIMIGRGKYSERAVVSVGRWITRLVLIIFLVELGLSVTGAILGMIGASVVELAIARYYIRPPWSWRKGIHVPLWGYAVPIFLATLVLRFLSMDLYFLKGLGASAAQAGIYGAAQNVAFVMPGVFAASFSPLLLSTIVRVLHEGDLAAARTLGRNAIRFVMALCPIAAIAAAESNEIALLLFGTRFADAGPLISILVFAGLAMMMINLLGSVLVAWGKPLWPLSIAAPLLPVAIAGYLFVIPRYGPTGAASVTATVTGLGSLVSIIAVKYLLKIDLPAVTLIRALLLSGVAYPLVYFWPMHGPVIIVKIAVALVSVLAAYVALGEFKRHEITFFWTIIRRRLARISHGVS
jgi:O-antigen/teichoic acid export membrane protein